jgi:hypothetical protein
MLKISLALIPFGDSDKTRNLGEMIIRNVGKNEGGACSLSSWKHTLSEPIKGYF